MNKLIMVGLAVCLFSFCAKAQKTELILRKAESNFYLEHQVVAKDNFYSLGRLYNVAPRSIAVFNKIDFNKGLNIEQVIRIPLTDTNFTQSGNSGTPVLYRAGLNTTLSRISDAYRKVPVEKLRYWNQRSQEDVAEGEKLIIGFLITREMPSVTLNFPAPAGENKPVVTEQPIVASHSEELKNEEKTEEIKKAAEEVKTSEPSREEEKKALATNPKTEGYFKSAFEQQIRFNPLTKQETVTAGIFKTSSGWEDGKYYLLMDQVQPGTVVKLVNPANNMTVFAKVLGEMSGIRLNEDLDIRISNAAASALQINDTDKFIMKVAY
jgi:hypothetical protein